MEHGLVSKIQFEAAAAAKMEPGKHVTLLAGDWKERYAVAQVILNDIMPEVEIHDTAADVFIVMEGAVSFTLGGTVVNQRAHDTKPGEHKGERIEGGTEIKAGVGDTVSIPRGLPHQMDARGGRAVLLITKVNDVDAAASVQ